MFCKNCGKQLEDGSKFCAECGKKFETEEKAEAVLPTTEQEGTTAEKDDVQTVESEILQPTDNANSENAIEVLKVTRIIAKGDLSVYSDRMEFTYLSDNMPVTETYHYFNIKNISVDNGMKIASLLIETVDNDKMFFIIDNENSVEVYNQKSELMNQAKSTCPALELLGLTEEDMKNELNENKEKRKGKVGKKIGNFISEYKNFSSLTQKSKIIHIAVPVLIVVLLFGLFSGGGASDEDYIDCAMTVASKYLKAPSTASYSDGKVVDKDDYDRVLVTFTVDSENSFGAYVRTYCAVVIESYDNSTGNFIYDKNSFQTWTDRSYEEIGIEAAKMFGDWDEPLED